MATVEDMCVFAKVGEFGGFTAASKALNTPKATVSRAVARLEQELGVRLLERTTRRVVMTEVGKRVWMHCVRLCEEAEQAKAEAVEQMGRPAGLLRVAATASLAPMVVAPWLAEFVLRHPELNVELVQCAEPPHPLRDGFDLVLQAGKPADESLVAQKIGAGRALLVASPLYLSQALEPGVPEDLAGHHVLISGVIAPTTGDRQLLRLESGTGSVTVSLRSRVITTDPLLSYRLALDGVGITTVPWLLARTQLETGELVEVLPEWRVASFPVFYAVFPHRRSLVAKSRVFIDWLKERFPQ